jgi:hypothetical protein
MYEEFDYSKPFRVRIIKDCRENIENKLDGEYGVCLGQYEYPDITKKMPEGAEFHSDEEPLRYIPLIKADNDMLIWGIECWWAKEEWSKDKPLDKLQLVLKEHIRKINRKSSI